MTSTTLQRDLPVQADSHHDDVVFPSTIPFVLVHLSCLFVFLTGISWWSVSLAAALYLVRMFGITAGYHRYFSHRSYKTSRVGQFVLAFLAQSSGQRGALWWAAKHRAHHKYSDTPLDVHSPKHRGFLYAHMGWIFGSKDGDADYSLIRDLYKYPELRFLNRLVYAPAFLLAFVVWLAGGWEALVVGFFISTVVLYHSTFAINSLAHVVGKKRYITGDDSRNNWFLALLTLGEGWHNNHHHYHTSTRQGFYWWEIDISYYVLRMLSWVGLVWDLRAPPASVYEEQNQLGQGLLDRVARQLAESFPIETISDQVSAAWSHTPSLEDLRAGARKKISDLTEYLSEIHLPQVPSLQDIRARAKSMFAETPSLEQVVERARQLILEELCERLQLNPTPA